MDPFQYKLEGGAHPGGRGLSVEVYGIIIYYDSTRLPPPQKKKKKKKKGKCESKPRFLFVIILVMKFNFPLKLGFLS